MSTKENPGTFDCLKNAMPGEEMFVLLARDPSAPECIEAWCQKRLRAIVDGARSFSDITQVAEAYACAQRMRIWRRDHNGEWRKPVPPAGPAAKPDVNLAATSSPEAVVAFALREYIHTLLPLLHEKQRHNYALAYPMDADKIKEERLMNAALTLHSIWMAG